MNGHTPIIIKITGHALEGRTQTPRGFKHLLIEEALHQFKQALHRAATSATTYPAIVEALAPYVTLWVLDEYEYSGEEWAVVAQRDYERGPIGMAEIFATALANQARQGIIPGRPATYPIIARA